MHRQDVVIFNQDNWAIQSRLEYRVRFALCSGHGKRRDNRGIHAKRGNPLQRNCQYRLEGITPPARLWTLSAHDLEDAVLFNADGRPSHLLSRQLLREPDGRFQIIAGPDLAARNWLEVGGSGAYKLILRLYDSPITATGRIVDAEMPSVSLVGCPS